MQIAIRLILCAVISLALSTYALGDDDFTDNTRGPEWSLVEDSPSTLWLDETNARLELHANAPTSSGTDALYLSDGTSGFQLLTSSDFAISIDYSFTNFTGSGAIALDLGVGRDLAGTDSAAIAFARSDIALLDSILGAAYRVGNVQSTAPIAVAATSGTLAVTYTTALDRLTLGAGGDTLTLDGIVQGLWGADKVYVSFGGRGSGLVLGSGDAYFDNFTVTGEIVETAIPEPATLALLVTGLGAAVLRKKRGS